MADFSQNVSLDDSLQHPNSFPATRYQQPINPYTNTQPVPNPDYIANLQNQNALLQQALINQQNQQMIMNQNAAFKNQHTGNRYYNLQNKTKGNSCCKSVCKVLMLIFSGLIAFYGLANYFSIKGSSGYQNFVSLYNYESAIGLIPGAGSECVDYISDGYYTAIWAAGLGVIGVLGAILSFFAPVVPLIGSIGYSGGAYYMFNDAQNNDCGAVWNLIVNEISGLVGLPSDTGLEHIYYAFMLVSGGYAVFMLLGTVIFHSKK